MPLLNLVPASFLSRYTGLTLAEGVIGKIASFKTAYELSNPLVFTRQGDLFERGNLLPNHTYSITFGRLKASKADIIFRLNPEIYEKGMVSAPVVFHPDYNGPLSFTYRPFEAFDIASLSWVASISVLE